jgi:hypothetical protein
MSITMLRADVISAKVLVWMVTRGDYRKLTTDAHRYFIDRYQQLAEFHRRRGHTRRAHELQNKADEHWRLSGGWDEPPRAAAMALPRPRRWVVTDAVGRDWPGDSNDAA